VADMNALQVTRHGPPGEVLAVRAVERPGPGPNEVRVQVRIDGSSTGEAAAR
jgi:NADPH:quinone reductase-like Zn-dependent oxidoreductase